MDRNLIFQRYLTIRLQARDFYVVKSRGSNLIVLVESEIKHETFNKKIF